MTQERELTPLLRSKVGKYAAIAATVLTLVGTAVYEMRKGGESRKSVSTVQQTQKDSCSLERIQEGSIPLDKRAVSPDDPKKILDIGPAVMPEGNPPIILPIPDSKSAEKEQGSVVETHLRQVMFKAMRQHIARLEQGGSSLLLGNDFQEKVYKLSQKDLKEIQEYAMRDYNFRCNFDPQYGKPLQSIEKDESAARMIAKVLGESLKEVFDPKNKGVFEKEQEWALENLQKDIRDNMEKAVGEYVKDGEGTLLDRLKALQKRANERVEIGIGRHRMKMSPVRVFEENDSRFLEYVWDPAKVENFQMGILQKTLSGMIQREEKQQGKSEGFLSQDAQNVSSGQDVSKQRAK